jgi:hypothetical protein
MTDAWRDRLAGARMQVDQQFADRVANSEFTSQQWGLIMTAVEFEIDSPGQPTEAELLANTDNVPDIIPELENLPQGMNPQGGRRQESGDGILGGLRDALGFGGDGGGTDEQKVEAATALVEEYTAELQSHLKDNGQWQALCASASGGEVGGDADEE